MKYRLRPRLVVYVFDEHGKRLGRTFAMAGRDEYVVDPAVDKTIVLGGNETYSVRELLEHMVAETDDATA